MVYYTDPGSGALLWQILSVAGISALFYINRILHWFRRLKKRLFKDRATSAGNG